MQQTVTIIYNICPLQWISNEILWCSTENYVPSLMTEHENRRKKNVCMYVYLDYYAVQ